MTENDRRKSPLTQTKIEILRQIDLSRVTIKIDKDWKKEEIAFVFQHLDQIKGLECHDITLNTIFPSKKPDRLRNLSFFNCEVSANVMEHLEKAPLETLTIDSPKSSININGAHFKLTKLKVVDETGLVSLNDLDTSSLKSLSLKRDAQFPESIFKAASFCPDLEQLEIIGTCLGNRTVLRILEKADHLTSLTLHNYRDDLRIERFFSHLKKASLEGSNLTSMRFLSSSPIEHLNVMNVPFFGKATVFL
ncbi:MAG: hypothetical protein ACOVOR_04375 [Rhabdochlamydiaceae bacterium]